jgi:2-keto-4-pentenoate hydratase
MLSYRWLAVALSASLLLQTAVASCLSDAQVSEMAQRMADAKPAANIEGLTDDEGACTRNKLTKILATRQGKLVGYKAGLTHAATQRLFDTDRPVWGKLYENMMLANGATVPAQFAARPVFESDLLVRVSSERINQARTPEDVLAAIDQVLPFIELPDGVVQDPLTLNGAGVSAINVGARLGVVGEPIATPAGATERRALLLALRDMSVMVSDGSGTALNVAQGRAILGHPLNAVVWLAQALAEEGLAMKPGDLISLGAFSPQMPPQPGQQIRVTYIGLPGAMPVQVNFN